MGVIGKILESRILWLLLGCLLFWVASRRAVEGLARDSRFLARPATLEARGPRWGGDDVAKPVLARLESLGPINLFDPGFEEKVRGALGEVPGVSLVREIRRIWPDQYTVSLRFHRPVAVVISGDRLIPVTARGVVLPYEPYRLASRGLVGITGVEAPPPALGLEWKDDALTDALVTLKQLAPYLDELAPLGIDTIDVSQADNPRRGVVVRGLDETTIRWGRPRAEVGENPVARKVDHLRVAARHLEQVRGFEIDVRYGMLYLRESSVQ